jgi:hypothetical protein
MDAVSAVAVNIQSLSSSCSSAIPLPSDSGIGLSLYVPPSMQQCDSSCDLLQKRVSETEMRRSSVSSYSRHSSLLLSPSASSSGSASTNGASLRESWAQSWTERQQSFVATNDECDFVKTSVLVDSNDDQKQGKGQDQRHEKIEVDVNGVINKGSYVNRSTRVSDYSTEDMEVIFRHLEEQEDTDCDSPL